MLPITRNGTLSDGRPWTTRLVLLTQIAVISSIDYYSIAYSLITMQGPAEDAEDSISTTDNEREDPNLNPSFAVRRKVAKRTLPWDLEGEELNLVSRLQESEEIRATKKPRLNEPFSESTDEAAAELSSHNTAASLPDTADADHADADRVKVRRATRHWTPKEDAKLNSAVTNTSKKKYGKEYRIDWVTISILVQGRTKVQCSSRWKDISDPNIDRACGSWTGEEDSKLKDAVQTHGGKNWYAIAALVPGRTQIQCQGRWREVLDPSIDRASGRTGTWTEDEDIKLKAAVQAHGGKNWNAIAALIMGRSRKQCHNRWNDVLDPNIERKSGSWTAEEDSTLKDAVQTHGGRNWGAITALVPDRTKKQCYNR
jgi:hypothetical protein